MCSEANNLVTCVRPDVTLGLAPPLIISVTAPNEPIRLTATTTVRSAIQDPQLNNNIQVTQSRMTGVADLALAMVDLPDPVALGSRLAYSVTVTNLGPSTATSIVFSMTLPSSVFYLDAQGDNWDCGADQRVVTCRQPSLPAGQLSVVRVEVNTANVSLNETLVTPGRVVGDTFDPELANNSTSQTTLAGVTDLAIQLQSDKRYLLSGTQVVYRAVVENKGPDMAAPVTVTVQLPAQVQFVEAGAAGWTCGADGAGLVTCTIPTLGVGTHVLPVSATITTDNAVAIATATVATNTFDQDMTNNQKSLALPPVYRQFFPVVSKDAPQPQ